MQIKTVVIVKASYVGMFRDIMSVSWSRIIAGGKGEGQVCLGLGEKNCREKNS